MQFIYIDLSSRSKSLKQTYYCIDSEGNRVIHNVEDPSMSPIIMWNRLVKESTFIRKSILVCCTADFDNYDALLKLNSITNIRLITVEELAPTAVDTVE